MKTLAARARPRSARPLGRWWVTVSVVATGVALSVAGFLTAQVTDRERAAAVLEQRAQWRAGEFQRKLLLAAESGESLAVYMAAEGEVEAAKFHAFARLSHGGEDLNSAVYWSPLVRDEERDAFVAAVRRDDDPAYDVREISPDDKFVPAARRPLYLPMRYEENFDGPPGVAGFDLMFRPARAAEIARIRDEGAPLATPPYPLLIAGQRVAGFIVLWPVYGTSGVPATVAERRAAFRGVATARFRLDRFLAAAIADASPLEETIEIAIGADAEHVRPIARFDPARQGFSFETAAPGDAATPPPDDGGIVVRHDFMVLNQAWRLVSHYPPVVVAPLASNASLAWGLAGLMLTALAGSFAWRQTVRRELAESRVSEQARKLSLWDDVFRNAAFGIGVAEVATDAITFVNPAFARMFGWTAEEFEGRPIASLYPEGELAKLAALLPARNTPGSLEFESGGLRKDGSTFPTHVHLSVVPGADGKALYRIASIFDISGRRKTEEKLRQAQKMEAVGNLTGGMAHDFNNLLAIVIGNLDLAIPLQPNGGEAAAHLHKALGVAVRGAELTRRLLAFARRQPLQPKAIDVNGLIAELTKLLSRTLGENIEIALDLEADVAPVVADPAQLEAALVNLSTNARDAMPAGGRLLIVTSNRTLDADYAAQHADAVPGDYVMIAVRDTGTGMPPEVMARVFEPFFTTKEVGKGSGLGLSMVFGFIRQSGGHTTVYSEPGIGTTFRLYLPRAATLPDQAPIVMPAAAGRAAGETILAVEDNEALRQLVIRQLTDLGYRVIEADGVAAALKVLERQPVDLLFSDVVMPGTMNGFDLAEWVQATRPGVKVLLTSGFPDARMDGRIDSSHDVADGSPRILGKPYCKEDLARALRDLLDNHHPETPPQA